MHRRYSGLKWKVEWDMVGSSFSWDIDEHFMCPNSCARGRDMMKGSTYWCPPLTSLLYLRLQQCETPHTGILVVSRTVHLNATRRPPFVHLGRRLLANEIEDIVGRRSHFLISLS